MLTFIEDMLSSLLLDTKSPQISTVFTETLWEVFLRPTKRNNRDYGHLCLKIKLSVCINMNMHKH